MGRVERVPVGRYVFCCFCDLFVFFVLVWLSSGPPEIVFSFIHKKQAAFGLPYLYPTSIFPCE
jgi:hypothetical protein